MRPLQISDKTRKLLWGRSAERCAICRCALSPLPSGASSPSIIGEEAHIVAQNAGGPRGAESPPGGRIHGYDNLVLLCRNDHRLVDEQPEAYPVARLRRIKAEHERWVSEALAGAGGAVSKSPADVVRRLLRESEARCIERWQALGMSLQMARELVQDPSVGGAGEIIQLQRPVTVLVGEAGSGKSLAGERLHQADLRAGLAGAVAPAPIWIRARDAAGRLRDLVEESLQQLGDDPTDQAVSLVVDGLDELGPAGAADLLGELRSLVQSRPRSRALATTRLLSAIGNTDERVRLHPLSEESSTALIRRVSDRNISLSQFSSSIREAAQRPLFALALGQMLAERPTFAPATPAEIIDEMVRAALGDAWQEPRAQLVELAIESLRRDGGGVRAADIVPAHQLGRLLATRLVVEERGRLQFPLIVFAQWFASDAILSLDLDLDELLDEPRDLELWRYPIAVAVARGSQRQADQILGAISRRNPAFASIIVSEATAQTGTGAQRDIATWREAGEAVRSAELTWIAGLGPLAEVVAPLDSNGRLRPLGASLTDDRLTTAWYSGQPKRDCLFELDPDFFVLSTPPGYGPARAGSPPDAAAWAWRWTRDELARGVEQLLNQRRLPLAHTPLEHEAVWTTALRALGRGAHTPHPIDASRFLDHGQPDVFRQGGFVSALRRYVDEAGWLAPPWPEQDQEPTNSWVWDGFSRERMRERAEAIFTAALQGYQHFAESLFASLASRMRMAVTMPAIARGVVSFSEYPHVAGAPQAQWHLEPLASGESRACFELGTWKRLGVEGHGLTDALHAARPNAARWVFAVAENSALNLFGASPAAELMYGWLWNDLKALSWVTGLPSSLHQSRFFPVLNA